MDPTRWREVKKVFTAALNAPEAERADVIQRMADNDLTLANEVLSLLCAHEAAEHKDWQGPFRPSRQRPTFSPPTVDKRFVIESFVGAGGFGVVYRAWDKLRERHVAIKTLRHPGPMGFMRLKTEFRTLADLTHPNLVRLYELFASESDVYFSMELVDGVHLIPFPVGVAPSQVKSVRPCNRSLVAEFLQLAEGVRALHHAGVLHGDLKPSNVLVTTSNRVVILDFGLASTLPHAETTDAGQSVFGVGGTPGYMAPELVLRQPASRSSDWYAFGVMLREALSSESTSTSHSMSAVPKAGESLESLRELARLPNDATPELASLSDELTNRDPGLRLKGREVIERLTTFAAISTRVASSREPSSRNATQVFVGRHAQLDQLRNLAAHASKGHLAAALICGRSGMGKTALVRRFLDDLRDTNPTPLILTARCHEREALTYKAFDGLVDGLSVALRQLSLPQLEGLRLAELQIATRLFPVLKQFPAIAEPPSSPVTADAHEQRRQAFDAFRELLFRLTHLAPLVIFIDDVQWGDLDSAALLRHLVRSPHPPPITWLIACREEELAAPISAQFIDALSVTPEGFTKITVGTLPPQDIRDLAQRELGNDSPTIEAVVREAAGVPIFAHELLFEARRAPANLTGGRVLPGLEAVMTARLSRLPPAQRALLDAVAIAAKPLKRATARQVARLEVPLADDAEDQLISKKLLRLGEGRLALETYHDSIRELATRILNPTQSQALHRVLAEALLARGDSEPEDIAHHLKGAGATEKAAEFAEQAAKRASATLAFGRAAALYRMVLELRPQNHADEGNLTVELAQALSNAGRGTEAAIEFERAAKLLPSQALPLTCKAAEQLLQSGEIIRGRALISGLLSLFGWRVPRSRWRTIASIALRRLQLQLRGLSHRTREADTLSLRTLVRLDASWALVSGLSLIDTVYANYFQNHHLIFALAAGEPRRLLRALAAEAAHASMTATPMARQRGLIVLDKLRRLAAEHPTEPIGEPMVAIGTALWAWMFGDWATCHVHAAHAAHLFRTRCTGVTWELGTSRTFTLGSLIMLGRYNEYRRLWPELMEDARARGDMFAETKLVLIDLWHGIALANDEPENAEREVLRALAMWNQAGFDLQEYWALHARVEIALYQGNGEKAWSLLEERRAELSHSLLLQMKSLRIWIHQTRARAALAFASQSAERRPELLRKASRDIRTISRERLPWSDAMVQLLRGLSYQIETRNDSAILWLARAAAGLDRTNMAAYAAAARLAQAELLGGDSGRALATEAERQLQLLGVRDASKLGMMLAPRRATMNLIQFPLEPYG